MDIEGRYDEAQPHFNSRVKVLLRGDDTLDHEMNDSFQKLHTSFGEFLKNGSGWELEEVLKMDISVATYRPLNGTSHMELPLPLLHSKS